MAFTFNPLKWFRRDKKDRSAKKAKKQEGKGDDPAARKPAAKTAAQKPAAKTGKAPAGTGGRRAQFKHDGWKLFVRNGRYSFQDMTQKEAKEQGYEVVYEVPPGYEIQEGAQKPVVKKTGATKKRTGAPKTTSKSAPSGKTRTKKGGAKRSAGSSKKASKAAGGSTKSARANRSSGNKSAAVKSFDQKQVTHGDYRLYRNGNRFYFSKKDLKEQKPGVEAVTKMPQGKEVTTTGNGLPVLRNA